MNKVFKVLLKCSLNPMHVPVRRNPYPTSFHDFLQNLPETNVTKLSNGLTIAFEFRDTQDTCMGLYFDAGSRYESNFQNGITHLIEHLAYTGTKSRSKTKLEEEISSLGAKFGCFTNRQMTAFFAECLNKNVPKILNILKDCIYNNALSSSEIETQKCNVYREMQEHDDNPLEVVLDYLHQAAFQGTLLAQSVMGSSKNLHKLDAAMIDRYIKNYFVPHRAVLAVVGGVQHENVISLVDNLFGPIQSSECIDECGVYRFSSSEIIYRNDSLPTATVAVAVEGPNFCDDDKIVMDLAANLIGGWDRSQAGGYDAGCNLVRAASHDQICDSFKSFNISYTDTGLWGIIFMCQKMDVPLFCFNYQEEWMKLCTMIPEGELQRAKREVKSKLLTRLQSNKDICHDIGTYLLYNQERPSLVERIRTIDRITTDNLMKVCYTYIYNQSPVVAAVGSTECLPEYNVINSAMYRIRW